MALNIKPYETRDHPCSLWRYDFLRVEPTPVRLEDGERSLGEKARLLRKQQLNSDEQQEQGCDPHYHLRKLWFLY